MCRSGIKKGYLLKHMKFTELLEEHNIARAPEGNEHQTIGWMQIDCPFCSKDSHHWRMGYNIRGGFVNCWSCGAHSLASVIREYTNLPYNQIKKLIGQLDDIYEQPLLKKNVKGLLGTPSCVGPLQYAHIEYLYKRGFDYKEIQRLWQIKGIGIAGQLKWRLFIPIHYRNQVVSWTTRSLREGSGKYISAEPSQELLPHKDMLYGEDYVRHCAIITEGPLDVWAIGPGAVATFGTAFSKQQILRLLKVPRRIVCFDNEKEAQRQARKLCDMLGVFDGETINVTLKAKDPGEAKHKELKKLRKFLE